MIFPVRNPLHGQSEIPFCVVHDEPYKSPAGYTGDWFTDRFDNMYYAHEVQFSPFQTFELCGFFHLDFILHIDDGPAPWTEDEMNTICEVFTYVSELIDPADPEERIAIQITKHGSDQEGASASPIEPITCGPTGGLVMEEINSPGQTYPFTFLGSINVGERPNENTVWHFLSDDEDPQNPALNENYERDYYTAILHEVMHLLGCYSMIDNDGIADNYSRWDRYLYNDIEEEYYIQQVTSPIACCNEHEFNNSTFSQMPDDIQGDCAAEIYFYDGSNFIAEVNDDDRANATDDNELRNKMSHLDIDCGTGGKYVLNPGIDEYDIRRILSNAELDILCTLGYNIPGICSGCITSAFPDDFLVFLEDGEEWEITVSDLLANDATGLNPSITLNDYCNPTSGLSVQLVGSTIELEAAIEGEYFFCYSIEACSGQCSSATVRIRVRDERVPLTCAGDDCNLVCYGDFEGFLPLFGSDNDYVEQTGLNYFEIDGRGNSAEIFNEDGNNYLYLFKGSFQGFHFESIQIYLNNAIEVGCEAEICFDARALGNEVFLSFYALEEDICSEIETPSCASGDLDICENGNATYCMTNALNLPNGISLNSGNDDFERYCFSWENTSSNSIQYILVFPNTTESPQTEHVHVNLDNIDITSDCDQMISITPSASDLCRDNENEIEFQVCLNGSGGGAQQVDVDVTLPAITGISISPGGDFNASGEAQTSIAPGNCTTLTLDLDITDDLFAGFESSIEVSATSTGYCFSNSNMGMIDFTIIDCNFDCACGEGGFNVGVPNQTTSYASLNITPYPGMCMSVHGTLEINEDVQWTLPTIRMQDGSEIVVTSGNSLTILYAPVIEGCNRLWKGITVESGATFQMRTSKIFDAEYAVKAHKGSTINISRNTFDRNYVGLYIPDEPGNVKETAPFIGNKFLCTENLLQPYDGHPEYPSWPASTPEIDYTRPLAGVILYGVSGMNIGVPDNPQRNVFSGLRNGIYLNNCNLNVYDVDISNLHGLDPATTFEEGGGNGIFMENSIAEISGADMESMFRGIYASRSFASIHHNSLTDIVGNSDAPGTAIQLWEHGTTSITDNTITDAHNGIAMYYQYMTNLADFEILNNTVFNSTTSHLSHRAIHLTGLRPEADKGVVEGNTIDYDNLSGSIGIGLNDCQNIDVLDNDIDFGRHAENDPISADGILLEYSSDCMIMDNTISSDILNYTTPFAYNALRGLHAMHNNWYCNSTGGMEIGSRFAGQCQFTSYQSTHIGDHDHGLQLDVPTRLGLQQDAGNVWEGSYDYEGYIHDPLGMNMEILTAQASEFKANPNQNTDGSIYFPTNLFPTSVIGTWFTESGVTATTCIIANPGFTDLDKDFLEPVVKSVDSIAMLDHVTKTYLYDYLYQNPGLLSSSTVLDSFFNSHDSDVIGDLHDVLLLEYTAQEISSPAPATIHLRASDMRLYLDSIAYVDSLLLIPFVDTATLTQKRHAMTDSVVLYAGDIKDIWDSFLDAKESDLGDALTDLGYLSATTPYEAITKSVAAIRLKALTDGVEGLAAAAWDTISTKAALCTLEDGPGVLQARGLLPLISDTIFLDDSQCIPLEERSVQQAFQPSLHQLVSVRPNPSRLGWYVEKESPSLISYNLINSNGILFKSGTLDGFITWISAGDLTTGLYFLYVVDQKGEAQIEKLQLIRN